MTTETVSRLIAPGVASTVSTVVPTALFAVVDSLLYVESPVPGARVGLVLRAEDAADGGTVAGVLLGRRALRDGRGALLVGVRLRGGAALVEVQVGAHRDARAAGAEERVEDCLGVGRQPGLVVLLHLRAGVAGGGGDALAGGRQHRAGGVGDGDLLGVHALDARGDQIGDRLDLPPSSEVPAARSSSTEAVGSAWSEAKTSSSGSATCTTAVFTPSSDSSVLASSSCRRAGR
jgi:hypothetical protein